MPLQNSPATIDAFTLASVKVTNLFSDARKENCQSERALSTKVHDFSTNRDFPTGDGIALLHAKPPDYQKATVKIFDGAGPLASFVDLPLVKAAPGPAR
jgi:hypothetical protein